MKLLKRILSLFLLLVPFVSNGQEPYFGTKEGMVLKYTRTENDGKVKWYHEMKIHKVTPDSIIYSSQLFNSKNKPYTKNVPKMKAFVDSAGVGINVAESMGAIFHSILGENTKVESEGDNSYLPDDMEAGDTLADAFCTVRALGMKMKISVTQRRVLRFETLETSVGTFDCVVVRERKVEKGMGRNRRTVADTWYSRGYGMIRHDTYNEDMELLTTERISYIRL